MASTAFDPFANQHAFYDAQHEEISEMFQTADAEEDWDALAVKLIAALGDPFLPRWYRAKFHAIHAWHCSDPKEEIRHANDSLDDMRPVLDVEGKTEEQIEERLAPIKRMIAAVEGQLVDADDEQEQVGPKPGDIEPADPVAPDSEDVTTEVDRRPKRKRTREVSPVALLPAPPSTGHRRKQPPRRVKSRNEDGT